MNPERVLQSRSARNDDLCNLFGVEIALRPPTQGALAPLATLG